jgi:magnesium chelatase family protein
MPSFSIVGLADKTIAESKERVRAALGSVALTLPSKRITVNLAPADMVKEGSHYDLPIALSLLASMDLIPAEEINEYLVLGELSLDGRLKSVSGVLPAAMTAVGESKGIICPEDNGKEALWSGNEDILPISDLLSIVNHFKGSQVISAPEREHNTEPEIKHEDLADIKGQAHAKRALEISAAGGHNTLMTGPPGSGKSMLASRMPSIMPEMNPEEMLESSAIASIAGELKDGELIRKRPYRNPHHSCSMAAMIGGGVGKRIKPGEVTLASNGVLFLDELPEFTTNVLDSLRQPIEKGIVDISRAQAHIRYPANFQLIAAMNPCRCGHLGDPEKACNKAPICGEQYQRKISGPILDRFDINIEVPPIDYDSLHSMSSNSASEETSAQVYSRVDNARQIQKQRYEGYGISLNKDLEGQLLIDYAMPQGRGADLLNDAAKKFKLSMRGYNRILRVARTIADLASSRHVNEYHISEALSFRGFGL